MTYRVDIVVHYSYDVEANSLGEAEDKGYRAHYGNETLVGDSYGELFCIDSLDEDGNILDENYYY